MPDIFTQSGATFSEDRIYRYSLWREWESGEGVCNFVMLNPSTADETANDPTVERCERRARRWKYRKLLVTNIFAYRATDPDVMKSHPNPVGPENDAHILGAACVSSIVILAWGNHGEHMDRGTHVTCLLNGAGLGEKLHALKISKTGQPAHPLYIDYRIEPQRITIPRASARIEAL